MLRANFKVLNAFLLVLLIYFLAYCTQYKKRELYGSWTTCFGAKATYTFNRDQTCSYYIPRAMYTIGMWNGTWRVSGNKLHLEMKHISDNPFDNKYREYDYFYKISNDTLFLAKDRKFEDVQLYKSGKQRNL